MYLSIVEVLSVKEMIPAKVSYLIFHFFFWEPNLEMHNLHWAEKFFIVNFTDSYQTAELLTDEITFFSWDVTYVFSCFIFPVVNLICIYINL